MLEEILLHINNRESQQVAIGQKEMGRTQGSENNGLKQKQSDNDFI